MESAAPARLRGGDRRRTHRFVLRERRSGFERRETRRRTPFGAALDASLAYLRDHRLALVAILALANLLSLLDFWLTTMALRLGAAEANPVMGYFFEVSATHAAAVKCCLAAAVTLGLWGLRRYRRALMTALFFFAAFGAVVLYEIVGLAQLT